MPVFQAVASKTPSLSAWLERLAGVHPHRVELGLGRVQEVARRLGLVPVAVPAITVAGTNGKGSTVYWLESMLQAAGYRTGAFTSPHLLRYNERVRIDAGEATDGALCTAFEAIQSARRDIRLTYFEFSTLAALWLFRRARVEVMLLEVGLGGRLDAVNIVDGDAALITSIGLDHTEWLGSDKDAIAREKAGIMRPGRPVISGEPAPRDALLDCAERIGAPLWAAGRDYHISRGGRSWHFSIASGGYAGLPLPSPAGHVHLQNMAAAVAALHALSRRLPVSPTAIREGLANQRPPGRFQITQGSVQLVFDVAHNAEAADALAENLRLAPVTGKTIAVIGMLQGKPTADFSKVLESEVAAWHTCGLHCERGQSGAALARQLRKRGVPVQAHRGAAGAWRAARREARPGDRILICGSFYTVAAVMEAARE